MSYEFDTRCIHGNQQTEREHSYGAVTMPIYQIATFAHPGVGKSTSYDYTRAGNPTRNELEQVVTSLEGGAIFGKSGQGFERINVACPRSTLQQALTQLKAAVDGYQNGTRE